MTLFRLPLWSKMRRTLSVSHARLALTSAGQALWSETQASSVRPQQLAAVAFFLTCLIQIPTLRLSPLGALVAAVIYVFLFGKGNRRSSWIGVGIAALLVGAGAITALFVPPEFGHPGTSIAALEVALWMCALVCITRVGVWALRKIDVRVALVLVGLGGILNQIINFWNEPNPWKFYLAVPVCILLLTLSTLFRRSVELIILGLLILTSILFEYRSMAILLGLALLLTSLGPVIARLNKRKRIVGGVALVTLIAGTIVGAQAAIIAGFLGPALQARAVYQTKLGQDPILGGRPELAAAMDSANAWPWGYGMGSVLSKDQLDSAVTAVERVGGDTVSPYLFDDVLGERVDFHSVVTTVWFHFGIVGLLATALVAVFILGGLALVAVSPTAHRTALLFILVSGGWVLFFSPLGDAHAVAIALAVALVALIDRADGKAAFTSNDMLTGKLGIDPKPN